MRNRDKLVDRANWTFGHAQQTRSSAYKVCKDICELTGLNPHTDILVGPTKTQVRMVQKAQLDYAGDFNQVLDPCRFMILFDDPDSVIPTMRRDVLPGKNQTPFESSLIERGRFDYGRTPKDMFETPKQWGYMGFLMNFNPRNPQKHVPFEIQMTHRDLHEGVYPDTHEKYEEIRAAIEYYEKEKLPFGKWDSAVRVTVMDIWNSHMTSAEELGLMPHIGTWPLLDARSFAPLSKDDITPVDYRQYDETGRKPGYDEFGVL